MDYLDLSLDYLDYFGLLGLPWITMDYCRCGQQLNPSLSIRSSDYRPSAIGGVIRGFGFLSAILEYKNKNDPSFLLAHNNYNS